jgi:hypothetical protein
VLEGVNRAPAESFLWPILVAYADSWKTDSGRVLSLFDPAAVDEGDPFAPIASFRWPANVLLVATLVEGVSTLPLPKNLWQHSTLILTDQMECESDSVASPPPGVKPSGEAYEVPLSAWRSWRAQAVATHTQEAMQQWPKLAATQKLPRGGRDSFVTLYTAVRQCKEAADAAFGIAAAHATLPLIAHEGGSVDAFQDIKTPYTDVGAALEEAGRFDCR